METIYLHSRETLRRLGYLLHRFRKDRISGNAAALTYMSLFALVPLLTVLYTMASAVPAFQGVEAQMEDFLFDHLMPESGTEVQDYLSEFSRQAKQLTGPGIIFLVVTAVLMLRNVENAFNLIWRARENRGAVSSFLLYWAVLSLAPLTFGLALAISTYLASFAILFEDLDVWGAGSMLLSLSPFALTIAGFSLIYVAVPNCRVPFKHAVIGGVVAALTFNIARALFTDLMVRGNYTFIYGAFAAIPLFLFWIYISWIIVLMGGVLVHSMSSYQSADQAARPNVLKALDILYLLWEKQQSGQPLKEIEMLSNRHKVLQGIDSETWRELRDLFLHEKVIAQTDKGHYFLSRDLHNLSYWQVKEWVNGELPVQGDMNIEVHLQWQRHAYELLAGQRNYQRDQLDISLTELFQPCED